MVRRGRDASAGSTSTPTRRASKIYGMPYSQWKERYQPPATEEQLARFAAAEKAKAEKGQAGK